MRELVDPARTEGVGTFKLDPPSIFEDSKNAIFHVIENSITTSVSRHSCADVSNDVHCSITVVGFYSKIGQPIYPSIPVRNN